MPEPQLAREPELGRFEPEQFKAADEAPVQIDWQPGTLVRLEFGAGSIVEKIPPIIVTGIVAAVAVFVVMGWLELGGRWLWAFLAGAAALLVRTGIEKSQLQPRQVRLDWSTRSATFSTSGLDATVPFHRFKELVLRGHVVRLRRAEGEGTVGHYWCELIAAAEHGEHTVAVGRWFDESDPAYRMMAPMAAELAAALSVPWRWEDFTPPASAILERI